MTEPSAQSHQLMMMMGRVTEAVEGLRRDVEDLRIEFRDHDQRDYDNRKLVYARMDEARDRLTDIEHTLKGTSAKIKDDVLPTIEKIKIWEQRGMGILAICGVAGTAIGGIVGTFVYSHWDNFVKLLRSL